ncbi:MAG: hypothetical protein ACI87E_000999 [Mariniblastus sp.]|jgi:hypothetical protein
MSHHGLSIWVVRFIRPVVPFLCPLDFPLFGSKVGRPYAGRMLCVSADFLKRGWCGTIGG